MTTAMAFRAYRALFAAAMLLTPATALASGGGGGGMGSGIPSQAAPAYDPAMEYQRGLAALQAGKFRDADTAFANALSVDPRNAETLFMLGMAKSGRGDLKGAIHAYQRSLKLDPQQIAARRENAISLAKLGKSGDAQAELAILKSRADTCGETCADAASLKAAMAAVQAALSPTAGVTATPASLMLVDPQTGDQSYAEGVRLIDDHRYGEALVALDRAKAAFGPHPDVLTYMGYVWRKLGQLDTAEAYYREALLIAPNHVGATEYYGELMVVRGDLAGARHMLAKLEATCHFGCIESEDLRRWIENGPPAS